MIVKKVTLVLGKETFGNKNPEVAFQEAFTPYFVEKAGDEGERLNCLHKSSVKYGGKKSSKITQ
ncbi:hypothetical protein ADL26_01480 [Thermoactinomyces vulgaris]|uniref:Uncharacterized protein n=1 Tax=Laceyella tengchongensis TaxID=574699 RepID=A0AA45WK53_9BACL|nr:hypothetical protein ADL26_01480 [Thermoactinomyces vulgaris]SMP05886.1 hypothetical protein SAMN06265361_101652 [Laceyella tengchongensis]